MTVAYIVLFILAVILYAIHYSTKNDTSDIAGTIAGLIATIIAVIAINTHGSSKGMYVTYVNGVRVSSGVMIVVNYIAFFMIFGAVSIGGSRGIGWIIGHPRNNGRKASKSKGLNVIKLIASIIGIPFSSAFISASVSGFTRASQFMVANILSLVAGIVIMALSIWGIISFINWRKKADGHR